MESGPYFTESQNEALVWVARICGWSSTVASFVVVLTFLLFRWRFPANMALYFSLCSMLLSLIMCISFDFIGVPRIFYPEWSTVCRMQAVGIQYFANCLLWWWSSITLNLYVVVVLGYSSPEKLSWLYNIIGWGIPAFFTFVPLYFDKYGPVAGEPWCWVTRANDHLWQYLFFYGWMGTCCFIGLLMWIHVMYVAFSMHKERQVSFFQAYILRHIMFVIFELVAFALLVSNRVQLSVDSANFPLAIAAAIVSAGQGVISFICFGISKMNVELWMTAAKRIKNRVVARSESVEDTYEDDYD